MSAAYPRESRGRSSNTAIADAFDELADLYELDGAIVHRVARLSHGREGRPRRDRLGRRAHAAGPRDDAARGSARRSRRRSRRCSTRGRSRRSRSCARSSRPASSTITRLPGLGPKRVRTTLRRARHRLARRAARGGGDRAAARRQGLRRRSSRRACSPRSTAGVAERPAQRAVLPHGARGRRAGRRGAARPPGGGPRRARGLRAPARRLGEGPGHHRRRRRPARRWPPRWRSSTSSSPRRRRRRERRARRARTTAWASTCGSSSPTSSATCCSTSPARARTTWRCARRAVRRGLHVSRVRDPRRRDRRDARAARPRRRSTSGSGCRGSRRSCARTAASCDGLESPAARRRVETCAAICTATRRSPTAATRSRRWRSAALDARLRVPRDHRPLGDARLRRPRDARRAARQIERVRELNEAIDGIELLVGTETNILPDGSLGLRRRPARRARLGRRLGAHLVRRWPRGR